jgi:hypothetical protein
MPLTVVIIHHLQDGNDSITIDGTGTAIRLGSVGSVRSFYVLINSSIEDNSIFEQLE